MHPKPRRTTAPATVYAYRGLTSMLKRLAGSGSSTLLMKSCNVQRQYEAPVTRKRHIDPISHTSTISRASVSVLLAFDLSRHLRA